MWTLKMAVKEKWNVYNERTAKFGVRIYFRSHNYYSEKGNVYLAASGIVEGSKSSVSGFFSDLKTDPKVKHLDINGTFFYCIYAESKRAGRAQSVKIAYNPRLVFLKPVIIDESGWERWEIGSVMRGDLDEFIRQAMRINRVSYKIFYLKNKKIDDILIYSAAPRLTEKQRKAILLAVEHGYYGYPRKTTLERLAKQQRVSTSTFHFHLATAEKKLVPFAISQQLS